jgi:hypothetical protein
MRRGGRPPRRVYTGSIYHHEWVEGYSTSPRCAPDLPSLRNLRLTSKAFHQAATRILLLCSTISWSPGYPLKKYEPLHHYLLSGASLCSEIKRFRLAFGGSLSDFVRWNDKKDDILLSQPLHITDIAIRSLPIALGNLVGLEFLDVSIGPFSGQWKSTCERHDWEGQILPASAPHVEIELISLFTNQMASCLKSPSMEHLTTLRLALPSTHNFVEIGTGVPDTLWSKLKLLFLDVTDATGQGGSKSYDDYVQMGYPSSNLQHEYPNNLHAHGIFDIVGKCTNLDTLGICGTHILDGNLLQWKPMSKGLKSIYLERIEFSAPNLIKLLSPAKETPLSESHLSKVWLADVDLTSGTWSDIFAHLTVCPSHWYLNPSNLSYSKHGESEQWRGWNNRPWENHSCLWSEYQLDEPNLKRLMRKRVGEAGGRDFYPDHYMEQQILE